MYLKTFPEGLRLVKVPVKEIEVLHKTVHSFRDETIGAEQTLLLGVPLLDIRAEFEVGAGSEFGFRLNGDNTVSYNKSEIRITGDNLINQTEDYPVPADNIIKMHIVADIGILEVFINDGHRSFTHYYTADPDNSDLRIFSNDGDTRLVSADIYELNSAWDREPSAHGCMDPLASNFNVNATIACDDCCDFTGIEKRPAIAADRLIKFSNGLLSVLFEGEMSLTIQKISGETVFTGQRKGPHEYSFSTFKPGIYIVKVAVGTEMYTRKVVTF
jgi:hypothetical protein